MEPISIQKMKKGKLPLHKVVYKGDKTAYKMQRKIISFLIKNRVNINAKDKKGRTALHRATEKGLKETVLFLIKNKADVNIKNNQDQTASSIAESKGYNDILEIIKMFSL